MPPKTYLNYSQKSIQFYELGEYRTLKFSLSASNTVKCQGNVVNKMTKRIPEKQLAAFRRPRKHFLGWRISSQNWRNEAAKEERVFDLKRDVWIRDIKDRTKTKVELFER